MAATLVDGNTPGPKPVQHGEDNGFTSPPPGSARAFGLNGSITGLTTKFTQGTLSSAGEKFAADLVEKVKSDFEKVTGKPAANLRFVTLSQPMGGLVRAFVLDQCAYLLNFTETAPRRGQRPLSDNFHDGVRAGKAGNEFTTVIGVNTIHHSEVVSDYSRIDAISMDIVRAFLASGKPIGVDGTVRSMLEEGVVWSMTASPEQIASYLQRYLPGAVSPRINIGIVLGWSKSNRRGSHYSVRDDDQNLPEASAMVGGYVDFTQSIDPRGSVWIPRVNITFIHSTVPSITLQLTALQTFVACMKDGGWKTQFLHGEENFGDLIKNADGSSVRVTNERELDVLANQYCTPPIFSIDLPDGMAWIPPGLQMMMDSESSPLLTVEVLRDECGFDLLKGVSGSLSADETPLSPTVATRFQYVGYAAFFGQPGVVDTRSFSYLNCAARLNGVMPPAVAQFLTTPGAQYSPAERLTKLSELIGEQVKPLVLVRSRALSPGFLVLLGRCLASAGLNVRFDQTMSSMGFGATTTDIRNAANAWGAAGITGHTGFSQGRFAAGLYGSII